MLNKLLAMLREYRMVSPGDTVVCAVSGGADSVALLLGLYLLREKLGISLEAAHFNHQLRDAESDRDEAFVRNLCDHYDIPLHVGSAAVVAGDKGLEAAARDARYAFMDTLPGKIATAHTADDNAETVLMHMVRGTGLKGLGGISPVRGKLIRPMLLVTRQQVLEFLEEYHQDFVEDSSNGTDLFLRNRLRHHVIPLLKEENPKLSENLSAMALRLREDEAVLNCEPDMTQGLWVQQVLQMPGAIQSRVLASFLKYSGVKEPDSSHIARAKALLVSENPSARADFPGGITLGRNYDRLICLPREEQVEETALNCPGTTEFPELGLRVVCRNAQSVINTDTVFTVAVDGTPMLRGRKTGDSLRLPGGTKSLKKLMIDKKIPAHLRSSIPVISDDGGILGVYGIGVNRNRVPDALPAVQIRFEKMNLTKK